MIFTEVKIWNLPTRKCERTITAHSGFVRGVCTDRKAASIFTVGDDQTIKQWSMVPPEYGKQETPVNTIIGKTVFQSIDHHWHDAKFATSGQQVDIWDEQRTEPLRSFTWGTDSIHSVKFNPVETYLLASCTADRNIVLYDMRGSTPLRKLLLNMRSNTIAWNPMEAFIFTAANEDYNLYTFDIRKLDIALNVHMDHVSAVMDVDYSPTGKEFVSGSFDKSIRIFPVDRGHSREIYHTKRMQHVTCVRWSLDSKYILSGSDETNIRIWKANASEKLGKLQKREVAADQYNAKLKEKFQHHPQLKRIRRHRHIPRAIYQEAKTIKVQRESIRRKTENRRRHSKKGAVPYVAERKKSIITVVE
ncbi:DDB1- and CUL4-associated factor 13-like isoform X2 [Acanthaster planci]|uniref:DDB1- and CUL4-associated factor 13-like isoform X2 n=1 Tax=Acanthaster planci TaxID=133434 RepID=A0A8B7YFM5_ACAPL|nr:DDB1- and CUL4-associated factor 13-like isoform X2 [Acanthaster planci]